MKLSNLAKSIARTVAPKAVATYEAGRQFMNSGYSRHAASLSKSSMKGWLSSLGSPDEDINDNLPKLRERSRDLWMAGGIAAGAIKTVRTNVVGPGLRLNPTPDAEYLNLTPDEAYAWKRNVIREFSMWANSRDCDMSRQLTFGQLQSLSYVSALMNGDVFALLPYKQRIGQPYDLRIQLIEADRVADPTGQTDKDIRGGIEYSSYGEAVAAWIAKKHPADNPYLTADQFHRVEFYGKETGRPNLLQISQDWERVGQSRAVPFLTAMIEPLKQVSRYRDAELTAMVVSSMFTVFVKTNTPENPLGDNIPLYEQVDAGNDNTYELGAGAMVALDENEDITTANPARTNNSFDAFCTAVYREIGASIELPYDVLMKAFNSSYSASRGALLEAWKMFKMRRHWLVQSFCQPIYEEWLTEAVAKGRIQAPGFFTDPAVRAAWCGAEWFGPTQGHLNPLQEANAAKVRIESHITTREREAAEMNGQDWNEIQQQQAIEVKKMRDSGTLPNAASYAIAEPLQAGEDE